MGNGHSRRGRTSPGAIAPEPVPADEGSANNPEGTRGSGMLPPSEDAPPPHPSVATKAGAIQCASPAVLNTLMARVAALEEAAEGRTMLPAKVDKLERQVKDLKARMQKMQAQFAEASPSHGTSSGHPGGASKPPPKPSVERPPGQAKPPIAASCHATGTSP